MRGEKDQESRLEARLTLSVSYTPELPRDQLIHLPARLPAFSSSLPCFSLPLPRFSSERSHNISPVYESSAQGHSGRTQLKTRASVLPWERLVNSQV